MTTDAYTTQLQAGLGLIEETRKLLELWSPGMGAPELSRLALESGRFPNVTSRRLSNIVGEGFKPRYLINDAAPAQLLKRLANKLDNREFNQLLFLYTCRANLVLADYVRDVYWDAYASGKESLAVDDARRFVRRANEFGKTFKPWSDETVIRVASYLPACCADFGLLESGEKSVRKILSFQIEARVLLILTYELHFARLGDNSILAHPDWALFGMDRDDVLNELKRQALKGRLIIQVAGDAVRIGWQIESREELIDVITRG